MHDNYWKTVKRTSEERICSLFNNCSVTVTDIIGHAMSEFCFADAVKVLAYVEKHGDCHDRACATLSFSEWLHAVHELKEHGAEVGASDHIHQEKA